jgi:hypothetical protein
VGKEGEVVGEAICVRHEVASLRLERTLLARLRADEAGRQRLLVEAERTFTDVGRAATPSA